MPRFGSSCGWGLNKYYITYSSPKEPLSYDDALTIKFPLTFPWQAILKIISYTPHISIIICEKIFSRFQLILYPNKCSYFVRLVIYLRKCQTYFLNKDMGGCSIQCDLCVWSMLSGQKIQWLRTQCVRSGRTNSLGTHWPSILSNLKECVDIEQIKGLHRGRAWKAWSRGMTYMTSWEQKGDLPFTWTGRSRQHLLSFSADKNLRLCVVLY